MEGIILQSLEVIGLVVVTAVVFFKSRAKVRSIFCNCWLKKSSVISLSRRALFVVRHFLKKAILIDISFIGPNSM